MARLDADSMTAGERYRMMTATIVPRPIAWVTSLSTEDVLNCAPFSFFNGISAEPPLISIAISHRRDGTPKDTLRNIEATGEFVIHVVEEGAADVMVETSGDFPSDESEVAALGLRTEASSLVAVPRLSEPKVAFECRLEEIVRPRGGRVGLVIGEVLCWHVADSLLTGGAPAVDVHRLRPMGRLGGAQYAPVREVREIERPR